MKPLFRAVLVNSAATLTLAFAAFLQPARAAIVILDDDFNDPGNNIGINSSGVGGGFNSFTSGGIVREINSLLQLDGQGYGYDRASVASQTGISINAAGTLYHFSGVSFTNDTTLGTTGNTDRLYLGVGNTNVAGDWQGTP